MTDDPNTPNGELPARQVAERIERLKGGRQTGVSQGVKITVFIVVLALAALFFVVPADVRNAWFGTSRSADIQTTSIPDPGITTQMTTTQPLNTDVSDNVDTSIDVPEADGPSLASDDSNDSELARLQEQLDLLLTAQGERGVDPAELQALLDAQAARLQQEFENQKRLQDQLHQQQLRAARAATVPVAPSPSLIADQEALQRLEEERARRAAIREEQIRSPALLFDDGRAAPGGASGGASRDLNANESFLASASRQPHETVKSTNIPDPSRTIVQGTVIEAVLETALSTELPGVLRAVTSVDVYSFDGSTVLLPSGTRLIGSYSSEVTLAQSRALIAWNRAVTPDGQSVSLGGIGGDSLGRSGQTGFVDTRFGERFGSAALISILGIAPSLVVDDGSSNAEQELAEDLGDDLRNTTASVLNDYLSLPPIIYVDQGTELTVFVDRDLVF